MGLDSDNFKAQDYKPKDLFVEDQSAYLQDRITSLMMQLTKLIRDCEKIKSTANVLLEEIRCLSIPQDHQRD